MSDWSSAAPAWARSWGDFAKPARAKIADVAGVGLGSRVLDVGCGSGEFLAELAALGASASGVDPAEAMVERARSAAPAADVRLAGAEALPWGDGTFDVVTAINALQFAADPDAAAAELARVARRGGRIAVANWAERSRNELDVIDAALADEPLEDGDLRLPGGLEGLLADAGLNDVDAGLVEVPWEAPGDADLVAGILFGDDDPDLARTVLDAARPFRTPSGGYRFVNHFRWAVGRT